MKVKFYNKKITEADEIQDGNDSNGNSQETNDQNQTVNTNTDTTELDNQVVQLTNRKNILKNTYNADIKVLNDQITALQNQKANIDNVQPENDDQAAANRSKLIQINMQLIELANKKNARKNLFNNDMKGVNQQLILINKEIAENGGEININIIDESEKIRKRFGKKLFEAVVNRTDEMYAAIKLAFDKIDNLSYSPDNTQCKTFAKNIVAYLNKIGWESGENEKNFKTFLYGLLNASHISFGNTEKDKFVNNLVDIMKENTLFSWVFPKVED